MIKASVLRYAAIGMASVSLAGFAAASTVTVSNTGPHSHQTTKLTNKNDVTTKNTNKANVGNLNNQKSQTGNVSAHNNTSVDGDLASGAAGNTNTTTTDVLLSNTAANGSDPSWLSGDSDVSYDMTGPNSHQNTTITNSNSVKTTNTNTVNVLNASNQNAKSGNVNANNNTTVGGLMSGDATNTSDTSTTVSISN